jgi:molybdopterin adenylyltransferase
MLAAVVTVSTTRGPGDDASGDALEEHCRAAGLEVVREYVGDDRSAIAGAIARLADEAGARFVFTTGGTGLTPDDVTPEATRDAIDREAPGYAEAIRADSRDHTPLGILTRGVSGIADATLIVNFPGSPRAIDQLFGVLAPTLGHVVQTLRGDSSHHGGH